MLNSNKPVKFIHLRKLANQSMLNGAKTLTVLFMKTRRKMDGEKYI